MDQNVELNKVLWLQALQRGVYDWSLESSLFGLWSTACWKERHNSIIKIPGKRSIDPMLRKKVVFTYSLVWYWFKLKLISSVEWNQSIFDQITPLINGHLHKLQALVIIGIVDETSRFIIWSSLSNCFRSVLLCCHFIIKQPISSFSIVLSASLFEAQYEAEIFAYSHCTSMMSNCIDFFVFKLMKKSTLQDIWWMVYLLYWKNVRISVVLLFKL